MTSEGSCEAIPRSHRRSLVPCGEGWWRRGVAGIPLVDLSEPLSCCIGADPRLIGATARENRPGDAGELIGKCDRQHVAVEPLRCLLDPRPQTPHRCARPSRQDDARGLHEQVLRYLLPRLEILPRIV